MFISVPMLLYYDDEEDDDDDDVVRDVIVVIPMYGGVVGVCVVLEMMFDCFRCVCLGAVVLLVPFTCICRLDIHVWFLLAGSSSYDVVVVVVLVLVGVDVVVVVVVPLPSQKSGNQVQS